MNRKNLLIAVAVISLFAGCALFARVPSLKQMSTLSLYSHEWLDDLDFEGIDIAIEQSISYYDRLPPLKAFQYGDQEYSPEEMKASLRLFMEVIKSSEGKDRIRQLRKKFLFFESRNTERGAFFTGYYEPVLKGSPVLTGEFNEPVYETPKDLIKADLGEFNDRLKGEQIIGRIKNDKLVPFDSREEIVYRNSLEKRADIIAYVNGIELFFLQIQGSGLIRMPDGSIIRVNYAQKNGHPYNSIGKILKEKIKPTEISLESIKAYLYSHPEEVREILSYNQSYVFFREVDKGPLGYLDVPLTPHRSLAMDRRIIPGGGLAFIETELPVFKSTGEIKWKPAKRFVLVQDTGGAIRGHGRGDLFLGSGEAAGRAAGHLKNRGRIFLLVAKKEFLK
jgi:membrane-bound lytic murein transglycosylase A